MKIYNEVVSIFNEVAGLWETTYEDSFEYNGQMAFMQGGLPPNSTAINTSDTIADTRKTTTGYFSGGDGTLGGIDIFMITGSVLYNKPDKYYFNVNHKAPSDAQSATQFSVTYGHYAGLGSDQYGDSDSNANTLVGETRAIYEQLAQTVLAQTEISGGFIISSSANVSGSQNRDDFIYTLAGRRERFKDRINKKAWTLTLSGSNTAGSFSDITLTDDSKYVAAVATPGGPRHNIVAGTLGVQDGDGYTDACYGWFYPEMGLMIFSGHQLEAALPGPTAGTAITASCSMGNGVAAGNDLKSSGFSPNLDAHGNAQNAARLARCMKNMYLGTALRLRSEEDQTQENYFCRIRAEQYNFSANPTFTSGSKNKIRNLDMHGDPQSFITGIGLYNSAGQLLAIAKLSKPLLKNFASEATVKVKLTY